MLKIWGLSVKGPQSYQLLKLGSQKKVCHPAPAPLEPVSQGSNPGRLLWVGPGPVGRHFLRPPTLTASNFAALWPTEPIFTAFKVLILFSTVSKDQKASSILKVGFALSKWPHLHRAYVISGCIFFWLAVGIQFFKSLCLKKNCLYRKGQGWSKLANMGLPRSQSASIPIPGGILVSG